VSKKLHTKGDFFPRPGWSVQYIEHVFRLRLLRPQRSAARNGMFNILNKYSILGTATIFDRGAIMASTEASPATAVERALNILEAAAQRRDGLTNSEISRKLGIPKSSASYILRTLERRGYLRRDAETARYRLGLKILSLGGDAQGNLDLADVALPFMRALVEKIRLTVHLAVLDQGEAVYIEKVEAPGFFKVNTWVGRRMFLHSTSVGKCLMAWLPKQEIEAIVRQQGLKKRTPETITNMSKLLAELEHVKQAGYAVDDEENSLGARCLGAPVFDAAGDVAAAIGASGTLTQMDEASMPRMIEALKETARRVSRQLLRSGAAGAA
jgi:DNA-binding IclR family transcriptional regulator